jgi:competence protein ComEC
MIPGDNESPSWKELLEDTSFKEAINGTDILVAAHHGREAGFCADLFEVIEPRLTIVSDDYETDSSAVSRYSKISTGWTVHHRSGADSDERCCVTTRSDGCVNVEMGIGANKKRYIQVTVE